MLDFHPKFNNIIFGVGLSGTHFYKQRVTRILNLFLVSRTGHGFKLSPVISKILCELALGTKPSYDLTPFRLDRTEQ